MNETSDGIGLPFARAEVADRLARDLDAERLLEQLVHPRARGDDDHLRVELVRLDASPVANVEAAGQRRERLVRAHDPGFRLQDGERALGNVDRIPPLGLHRLEAVPLDPAGLERARRALLERPDDLEQAVQLEQRLAALGLELTPEPSDSWASRTYSSSA